MARAPSTMKHQYRARLCKYVMAGLAALVGVACQGRIQKPARQPVPADASALPASPASERMRVFLMVGQSNMAGRARVDSTDQVVVPRVWMLDSALQWLPATDPMHFDKTGAGVGPGRAFGIAIAQHHSSAYIGLVPAAVGGTSIASWAPGAQDPVTKRYPFDDAIRRARAAMQRGELAGIVWHQGEGDANAAGAPKYEERLRALIARFRADLQSPDVPFIMGQVGRFPERAWNRYRVQVDSANRRVVETVPRTGLVSSAGLTHRGDTTHFDSRSARELGRRYAAKYLSVVAAGRR